MKLLQELIEAKTYFGEQEYSTWKSWKAGIKKVYPSATFEGDADICNAFVKNPGDKKRQGVGEWDGEKGYVVPEKGYTKKTLGIKEGVEKVNKKALQKRIDACEQKLLTAATADLKAKCKTDLKSLKKQLADLGEGFVLRDVKKKPNPIAEGKCGSQCGGRRKSEDEEAMKRYTVKGNKLYEGDIEIGRISGKGQSASIRFYTYKAATRFDSYCGEISRAECLEALGYK